jgi:hypothetical protein
MVYLLSERKYYIAQLDKLKNEEGKYNNEEYDTYDEAERVLIAVTSSLDHIEATNLCILNYDKPLYHDDYIISKKGKMH